MKSRILNAILAGLLAAVMIFTVTACGGGGDGSVDISADTSAITEAAAVETTTAVRDSHSLPDADLEGYNYRILSIQPKSSGVSWCLTVPEEQDGETLNDAVYERNQKVTEEYNFTLENVVVSNAMNSALQSVKAGDDIADIALHATNASAKQVATGSFLDFNTVPHLELDNNYWEGDIIKSLSVANKVYIINGDIVFCDDDYTTFTMYNRELGDDLGLPNMYEITRAGQFTYELMMDNMKLVVSDLNGDGVIDRPVFGWSGGKVSAMNDRIGMLTFNNNCVAPYFASSGVMLFEKDKNDLPRLAADTSFAAEVFEDVRAMIGEYSADWGQFSDAIPIIVSMIDNKQVLFQNMVISQVRRFFRDITVDFGLLPVAKYDEAQESYGTSGGFNGEGIVMPVTVRELDKSGFVLEALGANSYNVFEAYYTTCLESKYTRDIESFEMIQLGRERIVYDLAFFYDFGKIGSSLNSAAAKGEGNFTSIYASLESAAVAEMEKFIEEMTR